MKNYKFIINKEKHVVTCIVKNKLGEFAGIAKCDPRDEFDEQIGCDLARKRAVLKANIAEFEQLKGQWSDQEIIEYQNMFKKHIARRDAVKTNIKKLRNEIFNIVKE